MSPPRDTAAARPMSISPDRRPSLDKAGAAEYLGRTERYVQRLVDERRLPHYVVGRRLRFAPADLDEFLAQCRVEAVVE
jgi:excisionase family DNA binding protein